MIPVYNSYFGLTESPFNITPDPGFLFMSASHREALAQLSYGISARRGFVVLTGEVGTGKTTLIHALLGQLAEDTQTALIFSAISSPTDLLRYVCEEFKLVEPKQPRSEVYDYMARLNEFLLDQYRQGQNCALIIDEAQNLPPEVLESIRQLSNFETPKDKLLQILLVGQPELAVRLNAPELRQLKQRITLRHHLRPLSLKELQDYVANRLQLANGDPKIFTPKAIENVFVYSGGIPRLVNVICDNAMLSAYALEKKEIDAALIKEVAEDLSLTSPQPASFKKETTSPPQKVAPTPVAPAELSKTEPAPPKPAPRPSVTSSVTKDRPSGPAESGIVPGRFLDVVREALIEAMGPMAKLVLAERVKLLGAAMNRFPREKLGSLIEGVSQEIFDEAMRHQFRQTMSEGIRALPKA
jgi:general secretion pathway protein A